MKNKANKEVSFVLTPRFQAPFSAEQRGILQCLHPLLPFVREDPTMLAAALRLATNHRLSVDVTKMANPAHGVRLDDCNSDEVGQRRPFIRQLAITVDFKDREAVKRWSSERVAFRFLESLLAILTLPGDCWRWHYRLPDPALRPASAPLLLDLDKLDNDATISL